MQFELLTDRQIIPQIIARRSGMTKFIAPDRGAWAKNKTLTEDSFVSFSYVTVQQHERDLHNTQYHWGCAVYFKLEFISWHHIK